MTTRNSTLKLIKEKYPYLSDEFGVEKIGIFGSVAKETERKYSDIDIVVKLRKPIGLKYENNRFNSYHITEYVSISRHGTTCIHNRMFH